jgi:Domain of unknown function (DUF4388)
MPLAGTFRQYALPDVLEVIESGQRSGRMVATGASRVAHIYFVNGRWVHSERLGMGLALAEQLVQAGLITPQQLSQALNLGMEDTFTLPDEQLVRMLTTSGLLTLDQLREWATDDAVSMLSYMLTWTDGEFSFEDNIAAPAGELSLPLPLNQLVTRALQTARGSTAITDEVIPLSPEVVIAFNDIDPVSDLPVHATRDQWRLLSAGDGQTPLWSITDTLQAPEPILLHVAAELVALDLAAIVGRVPPGSR